VTSRAEVLGDGFIRREKALRVARGLESSHAPFPLTRRLVGILGAGVEIAVLPMLNTRQDLTQGRPVAFQLIPDNHPRHIGQPLQELAEEPVLRNNIAATVTLLSLPASIRDANHQEWDRPLLSDGPEAGAGSLAAERAGTGVAAEGRAPRPYEGVPHCNVVPMRAGCVAGGPRSEESESPGILAEVCQPSVRRWRSLGDSVGAFSGPSARNGTHAGRAPVRRSHPGHR
jgi:hypothetical protein